MVVCQELIGKTISSFTFYEDSIDGPEICIELSDGTVFSSCLKTSTALEAKVTRNEGGHGIRQKRDDGGIVKTLAAYPHRADEGTLSRLLVETTIMLAASRTNPATVLRDAASTYKVDTDAIPLNVKQEFAAK